MDYTELAIPCAPGQERDILASELADLGFDSFLEEQLELKAYIPSPHLDRQKLKALMALHGHDQFSLTEIPHQNWNAIWESNYKPVIIPERLFIGATFHTPPAGIPLVITLDPNMSFGTGHHPTTNMILHWMINNDLKGKRVFDFGAGSGVLSILASKLGASGEGLEIDTHAAEAARHNLALNNVDNFTIQTGDLSAPKAATFDIILANINRNIILERLKDLSVMLVPGGRIICSGFLVEDATDMLTRFENKGWRHSSRQNQEGWLMLVFEKHI